MSQLNDKSSALAIKTIKTKGPDTLGLDISVLDGTSLQKWRLKKQGDGSASIKYDGREYWWCSRHVDKHGRWNGMYVRHKEKDHAKVQAKFKRNADKGPDAPTDNVATPGASQRLVVSQRLREVLCSRLMVGDEDADEICADICSQVKY